VARRCSYDGVGLTHEIYNDNLRRFGVSRHIAIIFEGVGDALTFGSAIGVEFAST